MARRQTHPVIYLHSLTVISRGSEHFRLVTTIKRNKIANDINYGLEIGNYRYGGSQGKVRAECGPTPETRLDRMDELICSADDTRAGNLCWCAGAELYSVRRRTKRRGWRQSADVVSYCRPSTLEQSTCWRPVCLITHNISSKAKNSFISAILSGHCFITASLWWSLNVLLLRPL